MTNHKKTFLGVCIAFSGLFCAALGFAGFLLGHQQSVRMLAVWAGLAAKENLIAQNYLRESVFEALLCVLVFLSLAAFGLLFRLSALQKALERLWVRLRSDTLVFLGGLAAYWLSLPPAQKKAAWGLLAALTAVRIGCAFLFPFHIDEAFAYIFLVDKGFLLSASYYPGPNNHVLYTLLCCLFDLLPLPPEAVMRMPALLVSSAASILCFLAAGRFYGFIPAFLASLFFNFSGYGLHYAVHGRGYFLMLFFAMLFFYGLRGVLAGGKANVWMCAAAALGFYSLPSFLYFYVPAALCWFVYSIKEKKGVWVFVKHQAAAFFLTLFLYSPILLSGGLSAIAGNAWVQPLPFSDWLAGFPAYWADWHASLLGLETGGVLLGLSAYIFFLFFVFDKKGGLWLLAAIVLLPLAIIAVQGVLPFKRIWLHLAFFEFLALGLLAEKLGGYLPTRRKILQTALLLCFTAFAFLQARGIWGNARGAQNPYLTLPAFYAAIQGQSFGKAYINDDVHNVFLRLHYLKNGLPCPDIETVFSGCGADLWILDKKTAQGKPLDCPVELFYESAFIEAYRRPSPF